MISGKFYFVNNVYDIDIYLQLFGAQSYHLRVRESCIEFLEKHKTEFSQVSGRAMSTCLWKSIDDEHRCYVHGDTRYRCILVHYPCLWSLARNQHY